MGVHRTHPMALKIGRNPLVFCLAGDDSDEEPVKTKQTTRQKKRQRKANAEAGGDTQAGSNAKAVSTMAAIKAAPAPDPVPVPVAEPGKVITTGSGLRYQDLEFGASDTSPAAGDRVTVRYTASVKGSDLRLGKGNLTFVMGDGSMVLGFEEGIVSMTPGAKRRLVVPPLLAYGPTQNGAIPANSVILFWVHLIRIGSRQRGHENSSDDDDDDDGLMPLPKDTRIKKKAKPNFDSDGGGGKGKGKGKGGDKGKGKGGDKGKGKGGKGKGGSSKGGKGKGGKGKGGKGGDLPARPNKGRADKHAHTVNFM